MDISWLNRLENNRERGPLTWAGAMLEWRKQALEMVPFGETGRLAAALQVIVEQHGDQFVLELIGLRDGPQRVGLTTTAPYFGGLRYWFRCPGLGCSKRVAKLYLPPEATDFRCRQCHDLTYASCWKFHKRWNVDNKI